MWMWSVGYRVLLIRRQLHSFVCFFVIVLCAVISQSTRLSGSFLWKRYFRNTLREFLLVRIWYNHPLWLKDELIKVWCSNVGGQCHCHPKLSHSNTWYGVSSTFCNSIQLNSCFQDNWTALKHKHLYPWQFSCECWWMMCNSQQRVHM